MKIEKYDEQFIKSTAADILEVQITTDDAKKIHDAIKEQTGADYYYALKQELFNNRKYLQANRKSV